MQGITIVDMATMHTQMDTTQVIHMALGITPPITHLAIIQVTHMALGTTPHSFHLGPTPMLPETRTHLAITLEHTHTMRQLLTLQLVL
jgi:hypothetical protein